VFRDGDLLDADATTDDFRQFVVVQLNCWDWAVFARVVDHFDRSTANMSSELTWPVHRFSDVGHVSTAAAFQEKSAALSMLNGFNAAGAHPDRAGNVSVRLFAIAFAIVFWFGATEAQERTITVASTTSTEQSGLFGYLLPRFSKDQGVGVKVVAVGTGQALDIGRRGDAAQARSHGCSLSARPRGS
jgi:hypothetical protein